MNPKNRYDSMFQHYADVYLLDWKKLKAQAIAESNLDPDAVSAIGARGLAQFMPTTFAQYAPTTSPDPMTAKESPHVPNVYNPEDAIRAQAAYMAKLITMFGTLEKAWAAYNWGLGNLRAAITNANLHGVDWTTQLPTETKAYIARIKEIVAELA